SSNLTHVHTISPGSASPSRLGLYSRCRPLGGAVDCLPPGEPAFDRGAWAARAPAFAGAAFGAGAAAAPGPARPRAAVLRGGGGAGGGGEPAADPGHDRSHAGHATLGRAADNPPAGQGVICPYGP